MNSAAAAGSPTSVWWFWTRLAGRVPTLSRLCVTWRDSLLTRARRPWWRRSCAMPCVAAYRFEVLTAPFVVAHLQLYLLLSQAGAEPDTIHRPAIFLTNALTGWRGPEQLTLNFPELQEEHDAARSVKRDAKVIVVLGNPPYNGFAGVPLDEEAPSLTTTRASRETRAANR